MVTKEQLEREMQDLAAKRGQCWEMLLRYDGALQAVEALIALCDKKEDEQVNGELPSE